MELKKLISIFFEGVIHSETTSGVLNNVESIGKLVKNHLPGIDHFYGL